MKAMQPWSDIHTFFQKSAINEIFVHTVHTVLHVYCVLIVLELKISVYLQYKEIPQTVVCNYCIAHKLHIFETKSFLRILIGTIHGKNHTK